MSSKKIIAVLIVFVAAFYLNSCKSPAPSDIQQVLTKQQKAEDAVTTWIHTSKDYPHYKPVVFGDITPRYQKSHRTLQLSIEIGEEEAISKETGNTEKLDSLRLVMEKTKENLLGYIIPHKFTEVNLAGETITRELLFFLDTAYRVASVLSPESFDHILDESVFYRLDSVEMQ